MPALAQICIVIATIGLLTIAWMTVRMTARFHKTSEEISQLTHAVRESAVQFDLVTHEVRALVASLRDGVPPVLRVVDRIDAASERAAYLSSVILDECELPVFVVAAAARGVTSGATHFLKRLMHRFAGDHPPINGGLHHE